MTFEIDFVTFGGSGTPLFVTFAIDFFTFGLSGGQLC